MRMLLGIAGLTLIWFVCSTSSAQPMGPAAPKVERIVKGHGQTVDTAKKAALSKAVDEISGLMKRSELTSFVITEDYVRQNVVVDAGKEGDELEVPGIPAKFKAWVLTIRNDSDWWKDIVKKDQDAQRQLRADDRQKVGALTIVGLAFILLVGFGYVQLDEYTQRRYTTWLRVAGLGLATSIGAGWWLVFVSPR